MLPCSKNSIPYPGKSFSIKLIKKPREIGLNCSLRDKNEKCHRLYFWQVRKDLRKRLHEVSPRKSYRGRENTWTLKQTEENFWLASVISLDHPHHLFCAKKYFIFYIVWESGKPREGENPIFTNSTLSNPYTSLLHCRLVRIVQL